VRTRAAIGGVAVLALVVCAALAGLAALTSALGTCDGDGGYPFAARASIAGRMCTSTFGDIYWWTQLLLPIVLMAALGVYAVVQARWRSVWIGLGASLAATLVMYTVFAQMPRYCSDEQRRRLDTYECETY
jgi:hypothetical protein